MLKSLVRCESVTHFVILIAILYAAQLFDLLKKKQQNANNCDYPLSVYGLLCTGRRYFCLSLAFESSSTSKPLLLYHGIERVRVLPMNSTDTANDNGHFEGKEVNEDDIERVLATFMTCLCGEIETI